MAADLVVGVDLGTTALKAGLFDADGRLRASGTSRYAIERARPEWAEQQPGAWMAALGEVLESLAAAAEGQTVRAIGICSQVNTHVFVDAAGEALRPAITWQDQRCGEIALELAERLAEVSAGRLLALRHLVLDPSRAGRLDRTRGAGHLGLDALRARAEGLRQQPALPACGPRDRSDHAVRHRRRRRRLRRRRARPRRRPRRASSRASSRSTRWSARSSGARSR